LSLSISGWDGEEREKYAWNDSPEASIEVLLTDIIAKLFVLTEVLYREREIHHHEWLIKRKTEMEEENRQCVLDEEKKAREFRERQEKERIDDLLADADAMQKANIIRNYVVDVLDTIDRPSSESEIQEWANWALMQADRIDPLKNNQFLNIKRG